MNASPMERADARGNITMAWGKEKGAHGACECVANGVRERVPGNPRTGCPNTCETMRLRCAGETCGKGDTAPPRDALHEGPIFLLRDGSRFKIPEGGGHSRTTTTWGDHFLEKRPRTRPTRKNLKGRTCTGRILSRFSHQKGEPPGG
eukprot:gene17431-biopygen2326